MRDKLIPICLVTGFLGSGKTTFLKHVAATHADRRLVYLVNEFSPHDIDGALVSEDNPDVVSIPGGSIFCKCLVTEFISHLSRLPTTYPDVEGVVIEASGMANPKVIETMLEETGLHHTYELAHIISVVDPGSFMKLRHTLPNIVAQIEAADSVLLNKVDLYDESALQEMHRALDEIHPGVHIDACTFGHSALVLFPHNRSGGHLVGEYAKCRDPNYDSEAIPITSDVDPDGLRQALLALGDDLYRAKGYVPSEGRTLYVDYSNAGLTIRPATRAHEHTLVVILRGEGASAAKKALHAVLA